MKAAKIVFWNENDERYEMQLGQLTCDSLILNGQDTANVAMFDISHPYPGSSRYTLRLVSGPLETTGMSDVIVPQKISFIGETTLGGSVMLNSRTQVTGSFEVYSSATFNGDTTFKKLTVGSHETDEETGNIVPSNSTTEMNGDVRVYGNLTLFETLDESSENGEGGKAWLPWILGVRKLEADPETRQGNEGPGNIIFYGNLEPETSETMSIGSQDKVVKEIHTDVLHANTIVCDSFDGGSGGSTEIPTTLQSTSNLIVGSHTESDDGILPSTGVSELNGMLKIYGGLNMVETKGTPLFSSGGGVIYVPTLTHVKKIEAVNGGGGAATIYGTIQLAGHLVPGYTNKINIGTAENALKEVHTNTLDVQDTASVKNLIVAPNAGDTFKLGSHTVNSSDNSITTQNSIYECNGRFDVYGGISVKKTNGVQAFSSGGGFISASELKGIEVISGTQAGGNFSPIVIKGGLLPEEQENGNSLGNDNTRWDAVCSKTLYTYDIVFTESDPLHTISRRSVSGRILQQYVMNLAFVGYRYSQYHATVGSIGNAVSQVWDEMSSENGYKLTLETLRDDSLSDESPQRYTFDLRSLSDASFSGDTIQKLSVPIGGLVMAQMPYEFAQAHKDEEFHAGMVIEINDSSLANQWTEAFYGFDASSGEEYIAGSHVLEEGLYRVIMGFSIVETYQGDVRGPFDKPILLQRIR